MARFLFPPMGQYSTEPADQSTPTASDAIVGDNPSAPRTRLPFSQESPRSRLPAVANQWGSVTRQTKMAIMTRPMASSRTVDSSQPKSQPPPDLSRLAPILDAEHLDQEHAQQRANDRPRQAEEQQADEPAHHAGKDAPTAGAAGLGSHAGGPQVGGGGSSRQQAQDEQGDPADRLEAVEQGIDQRRSKDQDRPRKHRQDDADQADEHDDEGKAQDDVSRQALASAHRLPRRPARQIDHSNTSVISSDRPKPPTMRVRAGDCQEGQSSLQVGDDQGRADDKCRGQDGQCQPVRRRGETARQLIQSAQSGS